MSRCTSCLYAGVAKKCLPDNIETPPAACAASGAVGSEEGGGDMDEYDRRRDTIEAVACGLIMLAMIPIGAILVALMAS